MIRSLGLAVALMLSAVAGAQAETASQAKLNCNGVLRQGGFVICALPKGAGQYQLSTAAGMTAMVSPGHPALLPFARNNRLTETISATGMTGKGQPPLPPIPFTLTKGKWKIDRIDGLPPSKVTPRTAEQQKRVEADWLKKQAAWKHRLAASWYANGFEAPVKATRISGVYGSQRILNGQPKSPHLGLDFAAPTGTEIVAPEAGQVVLADPDMYFEGGLVVLDHGEGVMSVFLHMSKIDVQPGQMIKQGQQLGEVGMTGRATGPHLHWGVKVRGVYIDPQALLEYQPQP